MPRRRSVGIARHLVPRHDSCDNFSLSWQNQDQCFADVCWQEESDFTFVASEYNECALLVVDVEESHLDLNQG